MEIVQSTDRAEKDFIDAVHSMCAEANEAASLAGHVFEGDALIGVRRELARVMEIAEMKLLFPLLRSHDPD